MSETMEILAAILAVSATIWLFVGLGLAQLFRKQPARAHGVLVASLVGTLITPIFYLGIQRANWGLLPSRQEVASLPELTRDEALPEAVEPGAILVLPREMPRIESVGDRPKEFNPTDPEARLSEGTDRSEPVRAIPDAVAVEEPKGPAASNFPWKGFLLWGWLGATVLLFVRLSRDFLAGYRLAGTSRPISDASTFQEMETLACKLGLNSPPLLAVSEGIASPVLWAWSRPARILVPSVVSISPAFRGVYLHELAHLARRDHLSAFLGEVVCCVIPWHPLAWWAKRSLEARAEEACDDWAIAGGCQAADYAEELVNLAPSKAGVLVMAAVSRSSRLKSRVSRLLRGAFTSPRLGQRWVLGVGLAALLVTGFLSVLQPRMGQAEAGESETIQAELAPNSNEQTTPPGASPIELAVTAEGKPAAGAKVWLHRYSDSNLKRSWDGPHVSDKEGRLKFPLGRGESINAFGIDEKGRLGQLWLTPTAVKKPNPTLILEQAMTVEATVVHLGKPVVGVKCTVIGVRDTGTRLQGYNFPDSFAQREFRSDEQGKVRIPYVLKGHGALCEFADDRFGWHREFLSPETANTVSLVKAGSLEIEFAGPVNPLSPDHYQWHLTATKSSTSRNTGEEIYRNSPRPGESRDSTKSNTIQNIEPGKYMLNVTNTNRSPYLFKMRQAIEIRSEQITKVRVPTKSGVQVTGKIVDAVTGKGIPNYQFCLYSSHESKGDRATPPRENRQDPQEWAEGTTDQNGFFEVYVRGKARYGFAYPRSHQPTHIDQYRLATYDRETRTFGVQADVPESGKFTFPDLRLAPSQKVTGQIVDKQGRPANGTIEVFDPIWPAKRGDYKTECDLKEGSFEWIGVPPERLLNLRVRQGKAVNVPAELTPAQWKNGVNMVLDESNGVTFVGQIQDQQGHPVAKAQLRLIWHYQVKGEGGAVQGRETMETTETDEQGCFLMKGHWPKERYYLYIEKTGYFFSGFPSPAMNREHRFDDREYYSAVFDVPGGKMFHMDDMKMGQPGETVDYGVIRLVKNTNLVRGKTVGSDGQPVSGIQVIAATDGRGSMKATSDAQGRFEIGQLLDGPGFLVANGQGYRATYVPLLVGDGDVNIPMRKTSEAPPTGPVIPKTYLAAREKMVRHVLESIWKTRQVNGWGGRMLESMAELDPARAREWREEATPQEKTGWGSALKPMTYEEAVRLALINVEDGIAAAKKMRPARVGHLLMIGEKLLEKNQEISLRFAEEAVIQCRAMGPDQYIWKAPGLAWAGSLVWSAGSKESGRKLIQEGIEVLQQDPKNRYFAHCNGQIAANLAPIDWAEAAKRLELCVEPQDYNLALGSCIHQIAKNDPNAAKAKFSLFKEEKGIISSFPVSCRLHLVKQIGETDLEGALKFLEEIKSGPGFTHSYAQGLTELALLVHPKDPARAYALIDQAFDFLDQLKDSASRRREEEAGAILGAQIVYQAQKIGYPDPQALIARTLAFLGGPPDDRYPAQKDKWRKTAYALSFTDPVLAKKVLNKHSPIEDLAKEWTGGEVPSRRSSDRRLAGFILALVDPERTILAFDAMAAKGWTSDTISEAGISEIFGSFAQKGDLMEKVTRWEHLWWIR